MNAYDGKGAISKAFCTSGNKAVKTRVLRLYEALLATARLLLAAFAELQSSMQGPESATWLDDALKDGESERRSNNLRVMGYSTQRSTGNGAPPWTMQPPHIDPAWLSLVIQSGPG